MSSTADDDGGLDALFAGSDVVPRISKRKAPDDFQINPDPERLIRDARRISRNTERHDLPLRASGLLASATPAPRGAPPSGSARSSRERSIKTPDPTAPAYGDELDSATLAAAEERFDESVQRMVDTRTRLAKNQAARRLSGEAEDVDLHAAYQAAVRDHERALHAVETLGAASAEQVVTGTTTASGLLRQLNSHPASHYLIGSLGKGITLEHQEARPPCASCDIAQWALSRAIANSFNDLPAKDWSKEIRARLEAIQAGIRTKTYPMTVGEARDILSGAIAEIPPRTDSLNPRPIADSARAAIAARVCEQMVSWQDKRKSSSGSSSGGATKLRVQHIFVALLLNALRDHHKIDFSQENDLPSDEDVNSLFRQTLRTVLQRPAFRFDTDLRQLRSAAFRPGIKDTFDWLTVKFDEPPELRAIPKSQRWRLLGIDPQHLKLLEAEGIDAHNPLLAFMYDASTADEPRYANRMAKGRWLAATMKDRPLDVDLAFAFHSVVSEGSFHAIDTTHGGGCTAAGLQRMGSYMHTLAAAGIHSTLQVDGEAGVAYLTDGIRGLKIRAADAQTKAEFRLEIGLSFEEHEALSPSESQHVSLAALLEKDFGTDPGRRFRFKLNRLALPGTDGTERHAALVAQLNRVISHVDGIEAKTKDEAKPALARLMLDGEQSHLMSNANLRLFFSLVHDHQRARLGWPMSVMVDPEMAEGASYEEMVRHMDEGEEEVMSWIARGTQG